MESTSETGSAGIQSGRSFDFATDITISRPRSIGSILEYFSRFRRMEHELVFVDSHVDRPAVFKLERECGAAPCDVNVFGTHGDAEVAALRNNPGTDHLRAFSIRHGERYFLMNVVVELKRRKIGRPILGPGEEKHNQHEQNEKLPAAQAKH